MTDDPELLRLTEELRRIDRPRPPFPYITKPAKMREWVASTLVPWQLAHPEAEVAYHATKVLAVKRSDVAAFADADPAYECFEHFTKI